MEFAADIVGNDIVQRTSGEALMNTMGYAMQLVLVTVLKVLGVSLLLFSFLDLGNDSTSAWDAGLPAVDIGNHDLAMGVGLGVIKMVARIIPLPSGLVSFAVSAANQAVMIPINLLGRAARGIGDASMSVQGVAIRTV